MLEMMLESHAVYVAMGILAAVGILSKCMVNVTLKRLVRASGSMSKSNHPLMRLVRAKFEHACMISDTVGNVDVFVDKYLFEYKVAGVRLHSLRRMEKAAAGACIVVGILGSVLWYSTVGMGEAVLKLAGVGAALGIFVYLFHLTTDEEYRLEAIHNYMVDYLENVCLHKYEKNRQRAEQPRVLQNVESVEAVKELEAPHMTEEAMHQSEMLQMAAEAVKESEAVKGSETPQIKAEVVKESEALQVTKETVKQPKALKVTEETMKEPEAPQPKAETVKESETLETLRMAKEDEITEKKQLVRTPEPMPREVLIRQILEEFMA